MMKKKIVQISLLIILFTPVYVPQVFAHGLGGDLAPPISFGDMDVTVFTQLTPSDITVGEIDKANIGIRFFDLLTDKNLDAVTYRVEIWRSDDLLARELFYDQKGQLNVEVRPNVNCNDAQLVHCTKYFGEREQISDGLLQRGTQPPVIEGPIFDKGGLYNIKVDIEGASSPKTLVAEPLSFETFVSVAQEQNFFIQTAQAQKIPVVIKTYYDDVSGLNFDESDNSISFDMPFNWDPDYVDQVKVVHEEIRVPKTFEPYKEDTQFKGFVNGIELDSRAVLSDPYSSEDQNIVHFLVTGNELKRINDEFDLYQYDESNAFFKLMPIIGNQKNSLSIDFDSGANASVEWNDDSSNGITFDITFFDANRNLIKDVKYGFTLSNQNGDAIFTNVGNDQNSPGILASEGLDTQHIDVPNQGLYQIQIAIFGSGIGPNTDLSLSGIGSGFLEVGTQKQNITPQNSDQISIPNWVKNNAGWWATGAISDEDFASGIQFMIQEGLIKVPTTKNVQASENVKIPEWIRNNANWWSSDLISDGDFAKGLEFLVENGVISV